eukprot:PITA_07680
MAYSSPSSTSTAASPSSNNTYHVFISHRGPDVKKTLASHLYHRLFSAQRLRVFLDKPQLRVGDDFPSQIKEAIRTASVHVAIFSPGYAASEWCLNELLYMLESGAPIIPVFYHVQPADLRRTQSKGGVYSKALRKMEWKKTYDSDTMEEKPRHDPATIEKWREALSTVASISGLDLQETCNGDEGELVERIVQIVLQKVKKPALSHLTRYPVGLKEEIEIFEKQVLKNQQSGKVQVVGIVGIGGAGKTTLAVELYNRKSSNYDKFYFLHDVGAGKSSLPSLQRKLLKGLTYLDLPVDNIYEGTQMLRQHLSSSDSKLIVLDNVDDRNQVYALLPDLENVLSSSSFVLITCRDTDVLTMSGVKKSSIYDLNGLNPQYSLELFCLHAFSQPYPPPEFKDLVDKFLTACCGLPLSLEVFGALLYGENDITCWDAHFDRLRKKLPNNIQERLQISYDASNNIQERLQTSYGASNNIPESLQISYGASNNIQESLQISYDALDKEDRQIFLDIACFFVGEDRDMAVRIWDGSGWNGLLGFRNLQNRCLVQVDSENKIKMHEHLRDLGRAIAQTSGSRHCVRPSADTIDELLQQTSVRAEVRGIRMHPSEYKDNVDLNLPIEYKDGDDEYPSISSYKMRKLQLLDIEDGLLERILRRVHAPNLIWLRWEKCPCSSLPSWILMENLRVLEVHGNELETLWQSENQAPSQLRELKMLLFRSFQSPSGS